MKRLYLLVFVAACGNSSAPPKDEPAKVDDAYKADIEALCDVMARSGATDGDAHERTMKSATWLGSNLKSQEARKFLSKLRATKGEAKGDVLDAEAVRVGLPGCALSAEWRKPKP